ncbi:putative tripartite motif protein-containing protein 44, partial [Trichinella spiralis]|uniref:putative tripartite motif protein-containing protein 44 n=1 Tax=Trichinella spiralis TaxID=6334 RepID=UPI0001EFD4A0
MERTENHQETFREVGLEMLKLDDDQLKDYEKQVKPNDEDIEETGQDEQAMETDAENNFNSVIENKSEPM